MITVATPPVRRSTFGLADTPMIEIESEWSHWSPRGDTRSVPRETAADYNATLTTTGLLLVSPMRHVPSSWRGTSSKPC